MTHIRISLTTKKPVEIPQVYMHKEDKDTDIFSTSSRIRTCASKGCPAVFPLKAPKNKTWMTKEWQYYLIAINYNMTLENVYLLLDNHLAFANDTGFIDLGNPGKKDFFFNRINYPEYPRLDKDRTCSRNLLSGKEVGDMLEVFTMDGNNPPPMKPGRKHPQAIADIRLEDYLYNPKDHPWMFVVANTIKTKPGGQTSVAPFPRGAMYDWTKDGYNYSFLPLVSREKILYPLRYLIRLDMTKPFPSPYRVVTTTIALWNILTRKKTEELI